MSRLCTKCGKQKRKSFAGTITQWINTCECFHAANADAQGTGESAQVCALCKKIVGHANGSLTQWIFSGNRCRCEQALIVGGGGAVGDAKSHLETLTNSSPTIANKSKAELVEEVELQNVPKSFPAQRYKPLSEIGRGATGVVYMCRDRLLGKRVAIKMLQSSSSGSIVDFQKEAKIASALNHPGIVRVLDFGADDGQPYLVMDFVRGCNLNDYVIRNGPFSIARFLQLARGLSEAVDYAHNHDVVHRDLKPENIIIPDDPSLPAVILDFGLARASDVGSDTKAGTVIGTPLYMSPEQASGLAADWRSDKYSLGAVFYFMLTGRPPLTEAEFQECMISSDPSLEFEIEPPTTSLALNKMIAGMLRKNRANRSSSFNTVYLLLEQAGREGSTKHRSITTSASQMINSAGQEVELFFEKIEQKKRRREIMIVASIVMVLLAVIVQSVKRLDVPAESLVAFHDNPQATPQAIPYATILPAVSRQHNSKNSRGKHQFVEPVAQLDHQLQGGEIVECNWTGNWCKVKVIKFSYGKYLVEFAGGITTTGGWKSAPTDAQVWVAPEKLRSLPANSTE